MPSARELSVFNVAVLMALAWYSSRFGAVRFGPNVYKMVELFLIPVLAASLVSSVHGFARAQTRGSLYLLLGVLLFAQYFVVVARFGGASVVAVALYGAILVTLVVELYVLLGGRLGKAPP